MFFKGSWIYNKIGNLWTRWSTKEYSILCSIRCWVETYPPSLGHIPAEMFPFWDLRGGEIWVQIQKTHTSLVTMGKLLKPVFSSAEWQPCYLVFVSLDRSWVFSPVKEGLFFLCWSLLLQRTGSRALRLQELQFLGSRAQAQELWCTRLGVPRHVRSSRIRGQICVSWIGRQILYHWATREALRSFLNQIQAARSCTSFLKFDEAKFWACSEPCMSLGYELFIHENASSVFLTLPQYLEHHSFLQ